LATIVVRLNDCTTRYVPPKFTIGLATGLKPPPLIVIVLFMVLTLTLSIVGAIWAEAVGTDIVNARVNIQRLNTALAILHIDFLSH
jgi:hypothetical protein